MTCAATVPVHVLAPGEDDHVGQLGERLWVHRYRAPRRPLSTLRASDPRDWPAIAGVLAHGRGRALAALVITNPWVMTQVLGILVLVVLPSLYFGRRVRKLSRASQDRVADSSAIAAEVLNAIPVVQSYVQEAREAQRFDAAVGQVAGTWQAALGAVATAPRHEDD